MSDARDIAIIILAVESIIIGGLLIFLIIQVMRLIRVLQHEIKPLIDSTNETVSTVRGTTTFMSRHLVSPVMQVASYLSGVKRVVSIVSNWPASMQKKQTEAGPDPVNGNNGGESQGSQYPPSNQELN